MQVSHAGGARVLREVLLTNRQALGLTQEGLAERAGVSVRTIRNLEAGVITSPRGSTTELLLEALNVGPVPGPVWGLGWPWSPGRDRLVGRERDLEHVDRVVQRSRVVVLTGTGGVGKTRLAAEFADRAFDAFQYGVVFVQAGMLAADRPGQTGQGQVRAEIDAVLAGLVPDPGVLTSPVCGPQAWLGQKADLLLIIDNAEHVAGSAAQVIRSLLAEMPGVHVLVTSRRPLPVTLAQHWEVKPLACESVPGKPGPPPAVELFLERAEASCPTLDLSSEMSSVVSLCRRLDGLPFALELAAARIRSVPLATMLAEESISCVLGGADLRGLAHQGSLSGSVAWSYDLLAQEERAVLHQLTRFSGYFTFEDARACLADAGLAMADMLATLVDSSLLQVARGASYRYRLANIVREFLTVTPTPTSERRRAT